MHTRGRNLAFPKTSKVDGLSIRYQVVGEGPTLLLLHGWGGRLESWRPVVDNLYQSFRVCLLDFPGFGRSDPPPQPWGVGEYAQFLRNFMDYLEIERAIVVGHSFGARVAIRLAVCYPERVNKLILANAAGIRSRGIRFFCRRALVAAGKFLARVLGPLGQQMKERIYSHVASPDYVSAGALRQTFVRVVNEDLSPLLRQIKAETLLVWGDRDQATPLAQGRTMRRLIPNSKLVVMNGAGHFSYLDNPEYFCAMLRDFVSG